MSINESIVSIETHLRCHPHPVSFFVSINSSSVTSDNIVSIDKYHSISIIFINCYHIFLSRAEETTAGCCALPESRDRIKVGVLLMMLLLFLLV